MQHNVNAVGASGQQQAAHQVEPLRCVECAGDATVENPHRMRCVRDQLVQRCFIGDIAFELALAGHVFWRHGLHALAAGACGRRPSVGLLGCGLRGALAKADEARRMPFLQQGERGTA